MLSRLTRTIRSEALASSTSHGTRGWMSRGQMMGMAVVSMVAFLAAAALVADSVVLYLNWGQLQKSADEAALAGANYVIDSQSAATTAATTWVSNNGKTGDTPTITFPATNQIKVQIARTVPLYVHPPGIPTLPVNVTAIAAALNINGANGFQPIAVQCNGTFGSAGCPYSYCPANSSTCASTTLSGIPQANNPPPGGFVPPAWGKVNPPACGNGASSFAACVAVGVNQTFFIGQNIPTNNGNINSTEMGAINSRISSSGCSSPCSVTGNWSRVPQDPRNVLLLLVNFGSNGSSGVTITGFVSAWIQNVGTPQPHDLQVQMIQSVGGSGSGDAGGPSTGALQVKLIQ